MSHVRGRRLQALRGSGEVAGHHVPAPPVPIVRTDLPVCPDGRDACRCLTAYLRNWDYRDASDRFFITDARSSGYLCTGGAGLSAYYRANGLVPPGYSSPEITNWNWDDE